MFQKLSFRYGIILTLIVIRLAMAMQQQRLFRKLNELDLKIQRENILRREEINALHAMFERIEERLNSSLSTTDQSIDSQDDKAEDGDSIREVLEEFHYLKKGFKDEKKLASRLRRHVSQINNTMNQIIYKMNKNMEQTLNTIGMAQVSLDETTNDTKDLITGQNELRTSMKTFHDGLERHANETKQLIENMEKELKETHCGQIPQLPDDLVKTETTMNPILKGRDGDVFYKSCLELMRKGYSTSGVYDITLNPAVSVKVYCDQVSDGGGWTVFQRRQDGSVDFYRTWAEFKKGFGDLDGEFWLGNDNLHKLLSLKDRYELRIDMMDHDKNKAYAKYGKFVVGSESQKYLLMVEDYSGTAGDSLEYHNGYKFSTKDNDNDSSSGSCSLSYKGAWWYYKCYHSSLNGVYSARDTTGINWWRWSGHNPLKFVEMKFREVY